MTEIRRGRPAASPKQQKATASKPRTVSRGKVNTGVLIDAGLWRRFKIRCLEEDRREGATLEDLITAYLEGGK